MTDKRILNFRKILLRIAIWFIVNTAISVLIFSFLFRRSKDPLDMLFLGIFIRTQIISSLCAVAGYTSGNFTKGWSILKEIPIVLSAVLFAAFAANILSYFVLRIFFSDIDLSMLDYLFPSVVIAITATIVTLIIENLNYIKENLEKNINDIKDGNKHTVVKQSISVREGEDHYVIGFDELIYLSSHGKKSTYHTIEKDYVVNQLLKDIEEKLPEDNFIRIHRQFIINIKFLSRIKYYKGGRYIAYLKDEDESTLPVGKSIAPLLKERLGI